MATASEDLIKFLCASVCGNLVPSGLRGTILFNFSDPSSRQKLTISLDNKGAVVLPDQNDSIPDTIVMMDNAAASWILGHAQKPDATSFTVLGQAELVRAFLKRYLGGESPLSLRISLNK